MVWKILVLATIFQNVGCTAYHQTQSQSLPGALDPAKGVLISIPADGSYGNDQYRKSGIMTAEVVRTAFLNHAFRAEIIPSCKTEDCLVDINIERYGYFVMPAILHWEERATEWSGRPDRIKIRLTVFDAINKTRIGSYSYTGKSKWFTFGGDHPQELLPEPTRELVDSFYQGDALYVSTPVTGGVVRDEPSELNSATSSRSDDVYDQLFRLAELRDLGIVTEDEFQREKEELLSGD